MIPDICPYCGAEGDDFQIYAFDWVPGHAHINIGQDGSADWSGYTQMEWDGQRTEDYYTLCCDHLVDEELAQTLDEALGGNRRWDTIFV